MEATESMLILRDSAEGRRRPGTVLSWFPLPSSGFCLAVSQPICHLFTLHSGLNLPTLPQKGEVDLEQT